jgi:hypothetical protein
MFRRLLSLFRRETAPERPAREVRVARHVHVFTCAFDTHQGFVNYVEQHWTPEDAEPYCMLEQDLRLAALDRNYVETIEGGPDAIDAHVRPLLAHTVDADAVFLGAPRVDQAVLIYDLALDPGHPALRSTPQARYVGALELKP